MTVGEVTDPPRDLKLHFGLDQDGAIAGFVYDPNDLGQRFVVEIIADGLAIALMRAQSFWDQEPPIAEGDGCYGFFCTVPDAVLDKASVVEARLANTRVAIGHASRSGAVWSRRPAQASPGEVFWSSGLRITGWLAGAIHQERTVRAIVGGACVAEARGSGWSAVEQRDRTSVERSFALRLPPGFADGRPHIVDVIDAEGRSLKGSPLLVTAFHDTLAEMVEDLTGGEIETVRARLSDGFLPRSMPFSAMDDWLARFPMASPVTDERPLLGVVLIGENGLQASLESLATQAGCAWTVGVMTGRPGCTAFSPAQLAQFIGEEAAGCELIVFALAGTLFRPDALALLSAGLRPFPQAQSVYSDVTTGSAHPPLAFPAFDRERYLEQGYCGLFFAMRTAFVRRAVSAGADTLYRLFGLQIDDLADPSATPVHLPLLLAHLPEASADDRQREIMHATKAHFVARGHVVGLQGRGGPRKPQIQVTRKSASTTVSIILAVRNRGDLLRATLDRLLTNAQTFGHQIIIADNETVEAEATAVLKQAERWGCALVPAPGSFSRPRLLNRAAREARGSYLLFLESGLVPAQDGWLAELLGRAAEPDVGAVTPVIAREGGLVRHAGYVVGSLNDVVAPFEDCLVDDPGYADLLQCAHECSAVSDAGLLTPRHLFESVSGFDAASFAVRYYDVDFCLKLRARGFRIVVTPDARLLESKATTQRRGDDKQEWKAVALRDLRRLRDRWAVAPGTDPYYSPWLAADSPFSGLAWPPAHQEARQPRHGLSRRPSTMVRTL